MKRKEDTDMCPETWNVGKECVDPTLKTNDMGLSQFLCPQLTGETDQVKGGRQDVIVDSKS